MKNQNPKIGFKFADTLADGTGCIEYVVTKVTNKCVFCICTVNGEPQDKERRIDIYSFRNLVINS